MKMLFLVTVASMLPLFAQAAFADCYDDCDSKHKGCIANINMTNDDVTIQQERAACAQEYPACRKVCHEEDEKQQNQQVTPPQQDQQVTPPQQDQQVTPPQQDQQGDDTLNGIKKFKFDN